MSDNLPHMDYRQHRRARRLVHECCNYDEGNCLLLDDGEPCVCVQSISFSLMCHWSETDWPLRIVCVCGSVDGLFSSVDMQFQVISARFFLNTKTTFSVSPK